MVFRIIIRYLMHTFNDDMVTKLSDSRFFRAAARWTAFTFTKGHAIGKEAIEKLETSKALDQVENQIRQAGARLKSFSETFSHEVKMGKKEAEEARKQKR